MSEHGISGAANTPGARCCSPLEITQSLISSIKRGEEKRQLNIYRAEHHEMNLSELVQWLDCCQTYITLTL